MNRLFHALTAVSTVAALAAACDSTTTTTPAATATKFAATLTGAEEAPAVTTSATGQVTATLSADARTLTLTESWSGLSGDATASHIHKGAKGVAGPVVKPITISGTTGTLTWTATDATTPLTAGQVADLKAGNFYVNVHTAAHPGGEIRGQLLMTQGTTGSTGSTGNTGSTGGY